MGTYSVSLSGEHLERLSRCSPLGALEELIWNGLDAGGALVEVRFVENPLGGIQRIEVEDRGTGIPFEELQRSFGTLGKSLKNERRFNAEGRAFHGSEGRGRFKALTLGERVGWKTRYKKAENLYEYEVSTSSQTRRMFLVEPDPPFPSESAETGTVVVIDGVKSHLEHLRSDKTVGILNEHFAIYLKTYPAAQVMYDGQLLDPAALILESKEFLIESELNSGEETTLTVIEWKVPLSSKRLLIVDEDGFTRHEISAGVHARDINFTAYVKTSKARDWFESGRFLTTDLDEEITRLIETARGRLREFVRERLASDAQELVEKWKAEKIYPYPVDEPSTPIQQAERQVFDIVAARVHRFHEPFRSGAREGKQLTLRLVREALESNPTSLKRILEEVLRLPKNSQDDLAGLLQGTSLTNIIVAAKAVRDRLQTLSGFNELIFSEDWKSRLLERTQLHRLLVHNLWIFGEEYTLDSDDENLRTVLQRHLRHLGRELLVEEASPRLINEQSAIPDLMLSRRFERDGNRLEHLVLELKRPSCKLGETEMSQIKNYAHAVAEDERFSRTEVSWSFVLIGNTWDQFVEREASAKDRQRGCVGIYEGYKVWVRRWSDVLHEARARYKFFSRHLELEASGDEGVAYLTANYGHLLQGRGLTKRQEREREG